jgi:hypothetical protein
MRRTTILLLAATVATGCGGGGDKAAKAPAVRVGEVVYRDSLRDNHGGWFLVKDKMSFQGGRYQWRDIPAGISPSAGSGELLKRPIPKGLSVSVAVQVDKGAALRVIDCRELGPQDEPVQDWYELGIDGRQALIRRMAADAPPKVLARRKLETPNGRQVRLTAQCVPDTHNGLVLALKVDGRQVARARDAKPLPAERDGVVGTPAIRAYRRPDSPGPASVAWQEFEVRSATVP